MSVFSSVLTPLRRSWRRLHLHLSYLTTSAYVLVGSVVGLDVLVTMTALSTTLPVVLPTIFVVIVLGAVVRRRWGTRRRLRRRRSRRW